MVDCRECIYMSPKIKYNNDGKVIGEYGVCVIKDNPEILKSFYSECRGFKEDRFKVRMRLFDLIYMIQDKYVIITDSKGSSRLITNTVTDYYGNVVVKNITTCCDDLQGSIVKIDI